MSDSYLVFVVIEWVSDLIPPNRPDESVMSIQKVHLYKLLQLFYAPPPLLISKLRDDIRREISKESGDTSNGGDFHGAFWADAKDHVVGGTDLRESVAQRIAANGRRKRIYLAMRDGFLGWWNERRRWRNEPLYPLETPARARLQIPEVGGVVKVENLMGLDSRPEFRRLIYPYFSENPVLREEAGRLGLWAMSAALPHYDISDMRVLDVIRGATFTVRDNPLRGNERDLFVGNYERLTRERTRLRREY